MNVGELQHAGAAFDRMQRAEERVDQFVVCPSGRDVVLELKQIGVDLLEQFLRFVAEVRDELASIE